LVQRDSDNISPSTGGLAPVDSLLKRNLASLRTASPELKASLLAAETAPITLSRAADGSDAACLADGTRLCSLHQPQAEAAQLLADFEPEKTACAVVLGFGMGHHVRVLLERMKGTGLVIVFEPDLGLLKAVFANVDCSSWLDTDHLFFVVDEEDRGQVAGLFSRYETQLVAGTRIIEHPPSAGRLGTRSSRMGSLVADAVATARMSMGTLLMRSAGTVRNELLNIDHYALGAGIEHFEGCARGHLGIVVSAGPSLQRNIHELAVDGVRDRAVIIAAQTTLRPLLDAGIKPHFVAALDYHHISKRFYEGLTPADVEGTTLVALPQAHPVIADSWPGRIVWSRALVLEKVLGPLSGTRQRLPSASTVAHLAYLFARYIGCDPVALIGQDLGFTDGVYYTRGTAIDEVWTPELNPFNTIANLEWQRIVRHRGMLHRLKDINGRSILTDEQMLTYLRRFEVLFGEDAERGLTTLDASEGGVRKAHTTVEKLSDVLARHATREHGGFQKPGADASGSRRRAITDQLESFRSEVVELGRISETTESLLHELAECVDDERLSGPVFSRIDEERRKVESLGEVFAFVDRVNQLGAFKRYLADRRIELRESSDVVDRQRAQIQRDLVNVGMLQEAVEESTSILDDALSLMQTGSPLKDHRESGAGKVAQKVIEVIEGGTSSTGSVAALVPVDPNHGGSGSLRSMREQLGEQNVLQRTLERLGTSRRLDRIILLLPDDCTLDEILDDRAIGIPIQVERCGASPFGAEHEAIVAARMFADRSWRGGVAGMTVFDEVLAAETMHAVMMRENLAAAVICGGDWPMVEVRGQGGIDELVDRWRESNGRQSFVFTQAPPGLGACLLGSRLMKTMIPGNRLATIGAMIGYRPERPEHDPIAREGNITIDPRVRGTQVRAIFDSPRRRMRSRRSYEPLLAQRRSSEDRQIHQLELIDQLEDVRRSSLPHHTPRHVIIELCTGRMGSGTCSPHRLGTIQRTPMTHRRFKRIVAELADSQDALITLGGVGDPLQHPDCLDFISIAHEAGVQGIHVRTELQCSPELVERLARSEAKVITVDLNADTPETYRRAMGHDGFKMVIANMERLLCARRTIKGVGSTAIALPWVVPRIQRRLETIDDIEGFYERWQQLLGTPVIDAMPMTRSDFDTEVEVLANASNPARYMVAELFRRLVIYGDGSISLSEMDLSGQTIIGNVDQESLLEIWRKIVEVRRRILREDGPEAFNLRTYYS
jgi:hypothetical protein